MKLSRRQLATLAAASAIRARAQAPVSDPDLTQAARDSNKRNSDALAGYEIPLATEPAYQFKA